MNQENRIKPYVNQPSYWQYKGKPLVLRGASDDDNLYQWTGEKLTNHLDLLKSVGGNYVRNTMSDRDEGNVYPFRTIGEHTYDLNEWNDEFWNRLIFFLDETQKREIVPQLTLWDQHDLKLWDKIPWNPANNINYTEEVLPSGKAFTDSVKDQNHKLLFYQDRLIEKLMEVTLGYDHVLYNINNESWAGIEWENYWAEKIANLSIQANNKIEITTMHMYPSSTVRAFFQYRPLYSFVDISQINQDSKGEKGQKHWDELMRLRRIVHSKAPVPMNNEKIYGDHEQVNNKRITYNTSAGTTEEAVQRFWRDVFGGCASVRFHRPKFWGMGLSETARTQLQSLDMLLKELDLFECAPMNELLSGHVENGCYCTANIGSQYALYFPKPGSVVLDPWVYSDEWQIKWLNIGQCEWLEKEQTTVEWEKAKNDYKIKGAIELKTPGHGSWVALLHSVHE